MNSPTRSDPAAGFRRTVPLLLALGGLLVNGCISGRGKAGGSLETSVPAIASVAGIQVGCTTREELEVQWGTGKSTTGGHAGGARLWRVDGRPWVIWADAFEYSDHGIVVDSLDIRVDAKAANDIPYARLGTNAISWLGEILPGMTEEKVVGFCQTRLLSPTKTKTGVQLAAKGAFVVNERVTFHQWTAGFEFKDGLLVGIKLDAR